MGWTCTILHSIPWHFCVAAFAVVLLRRLFFLRFNSFRSFSFFFRARSPLSAFTLAFSRTNPEVPGEPGLEMLRLRAYTHRRLREEKRDSRLVFRKESSSYCRFSNFDVSSRLFRYAEPPRAILTSDYLCILFVAGLTDKIAPLLSNNIRVQSCRDSSTIWRHGNPIINDIRAEGIACNNVFGTHFF